jgi:hypothetical protein
MATEPLASRFCGCIKKVRKTVKLRRGSGRGAAAKEGAAIAICTKSLLQRKGRTLRKVRCEGRGGPKISTQRLR